MKIPRQMEGVVICRNLGHLGLLCPVGIDLLSALHATCNGSENLAQKQR